MVQAAVLIPIFRDDIMSDKATGGARPSDASQAAARAAALECFREQPPFAAAWVSFDASKGRVLIVGPTSAVNDVLPVLNAGVRCVALHQDDGTAPSAQAPCELHWMRATPQAITGHLGAFHVAVAAHDSAQLFGGSSPAFDIVLDLNAPPVLAALEKPPIGYLTAHGDRDRARELASVLHEWVGVFDKPRYFGYRVDLCAHSRRGLSGCDACLQACATQAIRGDGDGIEVDPYLCQGCGSCAVVCPSGAISYAYPPIDEWLAHARRALNAYREAGGDQPRLLLHDGTAGAPLDTEAVLDLLPMAVEEVGAWGIEAWMTLLAYGAKQVILGMSPNVPGSELTAARAQVRIAQAILQGAGHPTTRIQLLDPHDDWSEAVKRMAAPSAHRSYGTYAALGSKRETFVLALQDLLAGNHATPEAVDLPTKAPFGRIRVDREACTLCLACVSVCPSAAVVGGGDEPRLLFREDKCLQCGLCHVACPEDAITLQARMNYEAFLRPLETVLNEEVMAHCVGCGKGFAPQKLVQRMADKLAHHWMYQDERARKRLWMCEDCRVRDIFSDEAGMHVRR